MAKLDYTKGIELLDGARSVAVCGHVIRMAIASAVRLPSRWACAASVTR